MIEAVAFDSWNTIAVVPSPEDATTMWNLLAGRFADGLRRFGVVRELAPPFRAHNEQSELLERSWGLADVEIRDLLELLCSLEMWRN